MSRYDAVVIGAGVSGLSAALILAKSGKRVALLERNACLAPLLRRFKRDGVWCDPGFHYTGGLEKDGILYTIFSYLGFAETFRIHPLRADNFDAIFIDDLAGYNMPYGPDALEDYLSSRFPGSRPAILAYIHKLEEIRLNTPFLNPDLDFMQPARVENGNTSLGDFLRGNRAEPALVRLLGDHGMALYGVDGDEVPLATHGLIMGSFYHSAHIIEGGGDAIARAFKTALEKAGVEIFYNTSAAGFRIDEHRRLQAVRTADEQELECDRCISTIHPQLLLDMLPADQIRPAFIHRIRGMENTFSPYIVFYKTDYIPAEISGSNYYVFPSPQSPDRTRDYMALMSMHPACESASQKSMSVITACPPQYLEAMFSETNNGSPSNYAAMREELNAGITARLTARIPALKNRITIVDSATPLTYNRYTGTVRGSIYGLKQSVRQSALSAITPVHGLLMAGQSIQCGIMGAIISGFMAVCQILDPSQIRSELNRCR